MRTTTSLDHRERHMPWKYYCGSRSPHKRCIRIATNYCAEYCASSPPPRGLALWGRTSSGGASGTTGVPRIDASSANTMGRCVTPSTDLNWTLPSRGCSWRSTGHIIPTERIQLARNCVSMIVCIPNNADAVLCMVSLSWAAYPQGQ